MADPVVTVDGQVFESSLIEEWFRIQWLSSSRNRHSVQHGMIQVHALDLPHS